MGIDFNGGFGVKYLNFFYLIVALSAAGITAAVATGNDSNEYTEEYQIIEDAVQIQILDDEAVAFRSFRPTVSIELKLTEQVRDVRIRGLVGVVVTSSRLLAVSKTSSDWVVLPLNLTEKSADVYLSEKLVLAITEDRAIVFDSKRHRFESYDTPLGEQVIEQEVARNVAVFATGKRAAAYGLGRGDFKDISFGLDAVFRSLNASGSLATVQTSDSVLAFQAKEGVWLKRSRPLS
jgi:hypothetical protein